MAVALANATDVPPGSDAGAAAQAFAARLMDAWGVGEAGCNDGAVLLLSQQPRQVLTHLFHPLLSLCMLACCRKNRFKSSLTAGLALYADHNRAVLCMEDSSS